MKEKYSIIANEKLDPVKIDNFNIPERKQELKKLKSIFHKRYENLRTNISKEITRSSLRLTGFSQSCQ